MSVSNELSVEIAVAMLNKRSVSESRVACQTLLQAHRTLRELSADERHSPIRNLVKAARSKAKGASLSAS